MSLQDLTYNEVRIRQGKDFQQVPNFVVAHDTLADGQFVYYGADGEYHLPDATHPATHFVKRAGVARNSIEEIHDLIGTVQEGEPVMAFTGQGTVTLPFAGNVSNGDVLMVTNGYLVKWNDAAGYVVGKALEDVTIAAGDTYAWGEAFISLPAQYRAAV